MGGGGDLAWLMGMCERVFLFAFARGWAYDLLVFDSLFFRWCGVVWWCARQVERVMSFDLEKQKLLERKLKDRFLNGIETEFIQLHALRSGHIVSSFRTSHLREALVQSLRQVRQRRHAVFFVGVCTGVSKCMLELGSECVVVACVRACWAHVVCLLRDVCVSGGGWCSCLCHERARLQAFHQTGARARVRVCLLQVHSLIDVEGQAAGDTKPRDRVRGKAAAKGAGAAASAADAKGAAEATSRWEAGAALCFPAPLAPVLCAHPTDQRIAALPCGRAVQLACVPAWDCEWGGCVPVGRATVQRACPVRCVAWPVHPSSRRPPLYPQHAIANACAPLLPSPPSVVWCASFEIRKALRLKRKAALAAMAGRRPKPDEEDPADVLAVQEATRNMGDFKLKSSPDYEVRVCAGCPAARVPCCERACDVGCFPCLVLLSVLARALSVIAEVCFC
jgi:hypothetical protein